MFADVYGENRTLLITSSSSEYVRAAPGWACGCVCCDALTVHARVLVRAPSSALAALDRRLLAGWRPPRAGCDGPVGQRPADGRACAWRRAPGPPRLRALPLLTSCAGGVPLSVRAGQVESLLVGEQNGDLFAWGKPAVAESLLWTADPFYGQIRSGTDRQRAYAGSGAPG